MKIGIDNRVSNPEEVIKLVRKRAAKKSIQADVDVGVEVDDVGVEVDDVDEELLDAVSNMGASSINCCIISIHCNLFPIFLQSINILEDEAEKILLGDFHPHGKPRPKPVQNTAKSGPFDVQSMGGLGRTFRFNNCDKDWHYS
jgi:hypothetical protein